MKNKSVRTEIQKSFLWNFKLYAFIGCLAFPLNVLGESVSFDTDNVAFMSPSQRIKVTGIVKDEAGITLPGVNVVVKGTIIGTITDANGQFTLEAPSDGVLLFTYVGFGNLELPVNGKENLEIIMKEGDTQLEEVVVVGYGTQKKVSVVGSISNIAPKAIKQTATTSLPNALSGRMPGIITRQTSGEPGFDAASIYIRGIATWGEKAPLVLVDGIERSISSVNPDEVESLSVLKDASATAVYGVKGANGVILINTKRGKQGKPQVSFRTESAILSSLAERNYIDGYEYASLMNEGLANVGKAPRWSNEELEKFRTGSDPYLYPNVDWIDKVLNKNSYQTINNLSVTGGNEIVRYYVNLGYSMQTGIYKTDKSNPHNTNAKVSRYNYRSNVDINLTRDLVVELGVGGIIDDRNYPGAGAAGIFNGLRDTGPIAFPVTNPDGSISGLPTYIGSNPWGQSTQTGYSDEHLTTIQSTAGLTWDLSRLVTKGLSVKGHFSFDFYHANKALRYKEFGIKQYIGKNEQTGEDQYITHRDDKAMGYSIEQNSNRAIYMDFSVNYQRTFDKHSVAGMLLLNRRQYDNLSAGTSIMNLPYRSQGLAMRATYDYAQRYFIEFNAGYNGSENFPKGKRMGFFPAISLGWLVSGESFWKDNLVSNLKLRFSHGEVGNDQIGGDRFLYLTKMDQNWEQVYYFGQDQIRWPGIIESKIGYNNVTWETAVKTNLGLDLGLWKDRFSLQMDFLCEKSFISSIINFEAYQVFEASTYTGIHCFKQSKSLAYLELDRDMKNNQELQNYLSSITYNDFVNININTSEAWVLTNKKVNTVLEKLNKCPYRLSDVFDKIFQGIATSKDDVYFLYDCRVINPFEIEGYSKYLKKNVVIENGLVKPLLKGEDVHRYEPLSSDRFVIFPYDLSNDKAKLFSEQQIATLFPKGYLYLKECEDELRGREKGRFNNDKWFMFGRGQGINYGGIPKLLAPEISFGGNFMFDSNGQYYSTTKIYGYIKKANCLYSYKFLLGLLNSNLFWFFIQNTGYVLRGGYYTFKTNYVSPFPVPNYEAIDMRQVSMVENIVDDILHCKYELTKDEIASYIKDIDKIIYQLYGLSSEDVKTVNLYATR